MGITQYSYQYIHNELYNLVHEMQLNLANYDCVVSIGRGGHVPGVIISHMIDRPLITLKHQMYDNGDGEKYMVPVNPRFELLQTGPKVLLVDDIADSGKTLLSVKTGIEKVFKSGEAKVDTLVVINKKPSCIEPTFSCIIDESTRWTQFPWENTTNENV